MDHPLTQFLLQYQYYVYRKLSPLVRNVGFPDVETGRKAGGQESSLQTGSEEHAEETGESAISPECSNSGMKLNDCTTEKPESPFSEAKTEPNERLSEEMSIEYSDVDGTESSALDQKVVDGTSPAERRTKEDIEDSISLEGNICENDCEKPSEETTPVDPDMSFTDLNKLRISLEDDSSNTPESCEKSSEFDKEPVRVDTGEGEVCIDSESDFRELEADMLEWESSDEEESETKAQSLSQENRSSVVHPEGNSQLQNIKIDENPENIVGTDHILRVLPQPVYSDENGSASSGGCSNVNGEEVRDDSDMAEVRQKLRDTLVDVRFFLGMLWSFVQFRVICFESRLLSR